MRAEQPICNGSHSKRAILTAYIPEPSPRRILNRHAPAKFAMRISCAVEPPLTEARESFPAARGHNLPACIPHVVLRELQPKKAGGGAADVRGAEVSHWRDCRGRWIPGRAFMIWNAYTRRFSAAITTYAVRENVGGRVMLRTELACCYSQYANTPAGIGR